MTPRQAKRLFVAAGLVFGIAAGWVGYRLAFAQRDDDAARARRLGIDPAAWVDVKRLLRSAESSKSLSDSEFSQVVALTRHRDVPVRRSAVMCLNYGCRANRTERAVSILGSMLSDADESVRSTALHSLYRLQPEKWAHWKEASGGDPSVAVKLERKLIEDDIASKSNRR